MNPEQPSSAPQRPSLLRNWLSLTGLVIVIGSLFSFFLLFLLDTLAHSSNPYVGILTYFIAPAFLFFGLFLTGIGAWRERKKLGESAGLLPKMVVDLSRPRDRKIMGFFIAGSLVFLLLSAVGSYHSYHFTESTQFCGQTCHTVMEPELGVMKTDAAERAVKRGLSWPAAYFNSRDFAKMVKMPHSKLVIGILLSGYSSAKQLAYMANAFKAIRVATEDGDSKTGVLPVGQVQGLVHDQPTVAELFERMEKEAQNAQNRIAAALS